MASWGSLMVGKLPQPQPSPGPGLVLHPKSEVWEGLQIHFSQKRSPLKSDTHTHTHTTSIKLWKRSGRDLERFGTGLERCGTKSGKLARKPLKTIVQPEGKGWVQHVHSKKQGV